MFNEHDRRTFLSTLTGIASLTSLAATQQAPAQTAAGARLDVSWFDAFKGSTGRSSISDRSICR